MSGKSVDVLCVWKKKILAGISDFKISKYRYRYGLKINQALQINGFLSTTRSYPELIL